MDDRRFYQRIIPISLGLFILLTGCATVNLPGVAQEGFEILDDEQRVFNRTDELNEEIDQSGMLFEDPELEQYLTELTQGLLPDSFNADHIHIEVKLIKDPVINAYAMPTGRIYMNSSMIALMDNEAQLCAVLAHELTHILERHVLKVKRSTENKSAFFSSISLLGPISILGQMTAVTGFSQQIEYQADEGGFKRLTAKGYDPREAVALFQRVKQFVDEEDIDTPLFFSSHPGIRGRIVNFEQLLGEQAANINPGGKTSAGEFKEKTRKLKLAAVQQWINTGMYITALDRVEHYLKDYPLDAEASRMKGDIYRKRVITKENPKRKEKDKEDYHLAVAAYDEAVKLDPQEALALRSKGIALQKLGQTQEAAEAYRAYLDRVPDAVDKQYFEGVIHGR
ncbi:MAG: tetratricopeptide repeat protein [Candidatus Omnitrophota bacterium]